jgi:riboflavin synthase
LFTGIVEDVGTVRAVRPAGGGAVVTVSTALPLESLAVGDSVSVAGACLTVTSKGGVAFEADVSGETLSRTTLGKARPGAQVNLERALCLGGRLGGHLVYGHVDGTAAVREVREAGGSRVISFRAGPSVCRYVVFKGSVALDGVSLTVSAVLPDGFEATLIPHTVARTTFAGIRPGDAVNVEADIVGKYVLQFVERKGPAGVDLDLLRRNGFA